MKNVHLIPTDKPSRLYKIENKLGLLEEPNRNFLAKNQHIYITSDETIKEGDWVIKISSLYKGGGITQKYSFIDTQFEDIIFKKIILTIDQDLIADGIQAIDDEFLEWFVKNPSCEWVEVSEDYFKPSNVVYGHNMEPYKIIIPQEEPKQEYEYIGECKGNNGDGCFMNSSGHDCGCFIRVLKEEPKQETLEEAAENYGKQVLNDRKDKNLTLDEEIWLSGGSIVGFIDGAKWQQERMYSESDRIMKFLDTEIKLGLSDIKTIERLKWYFETYFEQFKKNGGNK